MTTKGNANVKKGTVARRTPSKRTATKDGFIQTKRPDAIRLSGLRSGTGSKQVSDNKRAASKGTTNKAASRPIYTTTSSLTPVFTSNFLDPGEELKPARSWTKQEKTFLAGIVIGLVLLLIGFIAGKVS